MKITIQNKYYSITDIEATLRDGRLPTVKKLGQAANSGNIPIWDRVPDIEPASWIKVEVIDLLVINTWTCVITATTRGDVQQTLHEAIEFSGPGGKCTIDVRHVCSQVDDLLEGHESQKITFEQLCIQMVNILHCDILPILQLRPAHLSRLKLLLEEQNKEIKQVEAAIIENVKSRAGYAKQVYKQRNKLIHSYAKKVDTSQGFCLFFGKKLLEHVVRCFCQLTSNAEVMKKLEDGEKGMLKEMSVTMKSLSTQKIYNKLGLLETSCHSDPNPEECYKAAKNLIVQIRRKQSFVEGIRETVMPKRGLSPHQVLFVSVCQNLEQVTEELHINTEVKLCHASVRNLLQIVIRDLTQGEKHVDISSCSRTGSTRCTDIFMHKSPMWQRPGEIINCLMTDEKSKLYQLNQIFVDGMIRKCSNVQENFAKRSTTGSLLRGKNRAKLVIGMTEQIKDLHNELFNHIKQAISLIQKEAAPKHLSEKTLWIKYQPYVVGKILESMCDLYQHARAGEVLELEQLNQSKYSTKRSSAEYQRQLRLSSNRCSAADDDQNDETARTYESMGDSNKAQAEILDDKKDCVASDNSLCDSGIGESSSDDRSSCGHASIRSTIVGFNGMLNDLTDLLVTEERDTDERVSSSSSTGSASGFDLSLSRKESRRQALDLETAVGLDLSSCVIAEVDETEQDSADGRNLDSTDSKATPAGNPDSDSSDNKYLKKSSYVDNCTKNSETLLSPDDSSADKSPTVEKSSDYDCVTDASLPDTEWNDYISCKILDPTDPKQLYYNLLELIHKLSEKHQAASTDLLQELIMQVIVEISAESRVHWFTRMWFLKRYFPYFLDNTPSDFATSVVCGAFSVLVGDDTCME